LEANQAFRGGKAFPSSLLKRHTQPQFIVCLCFSFHPSQSWHRVRHTIRSQKHAGQSEKMADEDAIETKNKEGSFDVTGHDSDLDEEKP